MDEFCETVVEGRDLVWNVGPWRVGFVGGRIKGACRACDDVFQSA